jgi:hypothetical protein
MGEENQTLSGRLVQLDGVALLDELADNLALVVLHDQDLLRPDHLLNHDCSQVGQDFSVLILTKWVVSHHVGLASAASCDAHVKEGVHVGDWQSLHLIVELRDKLGPIFQADLEDLTVVDLTDPDEVEVAMREEVAVHQVLNDAQVHGEEVCEEQCEVQHEFLIPAIA